MGPQDSGTWVLPRTPQQWDGVGGTVFVLAGWVPPSAKSGQGGQADGDRMPVGPAMGASPGGQPVGPCLQGPKSYAGEPPAQGSETSEFFDGLGPGLVGGEMSDDAKADRGGGVVRCRGFVGLWSPAVGWVNQALGCLSSEHSFPGGMCGETPARAPLLPDVPSGPQILVYSVGLALWGPEQRRRRAPNLVGGWNWATGQWVRGSPPSTRSHPRGGPGGGRVGCRLPRGSADVCAQGGQSGDPLPRRPSDLLGVM